LTSIDKSNRKKDVKTTKKIKKKLVNDEILDFEFPLGISRKLRYVVLSNFHFWSISIRALYQKLWSFEVSSP